MKPRVAILISGGGSNMAAILADMGEDHPAVPAVVISNVPTAGGLAKAQTHNVTTEVVDHLDFADRNAFERALIETIERHEADIIVLAGFMRILTADFVARFNGRILNIHPSLLPKFKGLDTHARALEAGEDEHGCTVHLVTAELDDGPILGQARVPVLENDTAKELAARVLAEEHKLYPAALRAFAKNALPVR